MSKVIYRKPVRNKRWARRGGPRAKWGAKACILCQTKLTQEEDRVGMSAHRDCALLECKTVFSWHGILVPMQNVDTFLKYVFFNVGIEENEEILEATFFFLSAAHPLFSFNRLRREAEAFG
ncbi:MAG: hypothetical protein Q8L10_02755 [Candidatus Moranbacteria bacterium]|nr:hypothetical protein [Candidatus Moranbacteria bacterium]